MKNGNILESCNKQLQIACAGLFPL